MAVAAAAVAVATMVRVVMTVAAVVVTVAMVVVTVATAVATALHPWQQLLQWPFRLLKCGRTSRHEGKNQANMKRRLKTNKISGPSVWLFSVCHGILDLEFPSSFLENLINDKLD